VTTDYTDMIYAATPEQIEQRRKAFIRKWRLRHRPIADCLEEAGDRLFTFTRLPPSQWRSARTTNAIERLHEEFKRRIKTQTTKLGAVLAIAVAASIHTASADPITYTESASATGSLGSNSFTNALVTITVQADTSGVISCFGIALCNLGTGSVSVAGVGTATFTNMIDAFVANSNTGAVHSAAGIFHPSIGDILDTLSSVFATYSLTTSIGPVTGSPVFNSFAFPTSGGNFVLNFQRELDRIDGVGQVPARFRPK
jgi:Transposase, Mutator family